MRNWLFTTEPKRLEYYKGMLIHADMGTHDQAIAIFKQYVPVGNSVLDVGAGAGAFSKRLADAGYLVTALDVDADKWIPQDVPFVRLDINLGVANSIGAKFDAVCCLEVIEHVENPWSLLRDVYAVLKPGGRLILSTPNVTSFLSRLIFLRTGRFHQFSDADLAYGHTSPITAFETSIAAKQVGLSLLETRPGGYLPIFDFSSLRPKSLALNILRGVAYLIAGGEKRGWCLFFILERPRA
jgi:2-polyprenyl-3-methyl-5-hydroxy-6-metoxy-1,4-benzoquinol methylase